MNFLENISKRYFKAITKAFFRQKPSKWDEWELEAPSALKILVIHPCEKLGNIL